MDVELLILHPFYVYKSCPWVFTQFNNLKIIDIKNERYS